jgi:hypothetical protein
MQPNRFRWFCIGVICLAAAAMAQSRPAGEDLTQDPAVRAAGTYTYFARGNGFRDAGGSKVPLQVYRPLTKRFYPGVPLHNDDKGGNDRDKDREDTGYYSGTTEAKAIQIESGELTDGDASPQSSSVAGWVGVVDCTGAEPKRPNEPFSGSFDILFDLGDTYVVTGAEVEYEDSTGRRWATTADAQRLYVAAKLSDPPQESDFAFMASATAEANKAGTMQFSGKEQTARYVLLRPNVKVEPGTFGSKGGRIMEVRIFGRKIEP